MNVGIDSGCGQDQMRARNSVSGEAKLQTRRDAIHALRIAGLADGTDESVLDADFSFDHALHRINNCNVGDDKIRCPGLARQPVIHAHAFAQAFASPEYNLVAKPTAQIALYLHEERRITQSNAIADRWTK